MFLEKWAKKYRRLIMRLRTARYDHPLRPAGETDQLLIGELRAAVEEMPPLDTPTERPSEREWIENVTRLKNLVLEEDPRGFLRWDVIVKTMSVAFADYIVPEYRFLKTQPDWQSRWTEALEECVVGHPIPHWQYPRSSANLIHHAYHVAQFEGRTGVSVHDMDFVFEFGGGYGSMCRLFYNLGFQGRYVIFDLPAFSALQIFFLKSAGFQVHSYHSFSTARDGALCISDFSQLQAVLRGLDGQDSMFLATWSLSEAPMQLRAKVLPLVDGFTAFLVAYQSRFNEIDNLAAFQGWTTRQQQVKWHDWRIAHLPNDNRYLMGRRLQEA